VQRCVAWRPVTCVCVRAAGKPLTSMQAGRQPTGRQHAPHGRQVPYPVVPDGLTMPGGLAPGSCQAAFVWNTPIACGVVVPDENGFGWGWTVVLVYALVGGAYIGGGVAYNRFHIGMPLSVEAVPHIDFWREVGARGPVVC
jgi:hypothetical protein